MTAYRSFADQTRHYFARAHEAVPEVPVATASVWRGEDLRQHPERWRFTLTDEHLAELKTAMAQVSERGLKLADVTREDFILPQLGDAIRGWRQQISRGFGFVVLGTLPVAAWTTEEAALAFWGIGHHFGIPGAQNPAQELLGHVTDYQEDEPFVRLYRTSSNINFHCDAADVVGLLCLQQAGSGGESRIVSSGALFNECFSLAPELVPRLFEPFRLDGRGESRTGTPGYSEIVPCRYAAGQLRTFYHSEYFRSVERLPGVALTAAERRLLDLYDSAAAEPANRLDMMLAPGDMQFLSNHSIVHARTAYTDDPERPRHLLRLWLSLED